MGRSDVIPGGKASCEGKGKGALSPLMSEGLSHCQESYQIICACFVPGIGWSSLTLNCSVKETKAQKG